MVKGVHLEGLRVLGKPEDFAKYYYETGADELFYQDVVASLYNRNSLNEIISRTAKKSYIPLTVGGGVRTLDDIKDVLRAGADKVCINTAAIRRPGFIAEACKRFGSSTIVIAIEAIKQASGEYLAYVDNGREFTGVNVIDWAEKVQELGAGEIVITSVDKEGTGRGFDCELTKLISSRLSIAVVAHGGGGTFQHFEDVVTKGLADAFAISSVLHYDFISKHRSQIEAGQEGNLEFLNSGRKTFRSIEPLTILGIKQFLTSKNILCRMPSKYYEESSDN